VSHHIVAQLTTFTPNLRLHIMLLPKDDAVAFAEDEGVDFAVCAVVGFASASL
jgi:hypothetical protein